MSFDEMKYEDFSWIRWDRMRWELVDLMISAAEEHVDRPRSVSCQEHGSCVEIEKSFPMFGVEIHLSDDGRYRRLDHCKDLMSLVTSGMRDGMMMVAQYIEWGSGHPLEGAMEVPFEVGRIIHSSYFTSWGRNESDEGSPHVSDEPSDEIRELLYAFVKLAFPDNYMTAVHHKMKGESFEQPFVLEETWFGEGLAWKRLIIREFFGGIQGLLMDAEWSSVIDQQIDLSHVRSLNEAIREIRGIDLAMFDKFNPLQGASLERNKVWEGQGLLWQNLALYETTEGYIGVFSNSLSFMADKEMKFESHVNSEEAVKTITDEDYAYHYELTLYADEGSDPPQSD